MSQVRKATWADAERMTASLVRAFVPDPMSWWLFEDPGHAPPFWAAQVEVRLRAPASPAWVAGDGAGVALWDPPGGLELDPATEAAVWSGVRAGCTPSEARRLDLLGEVFGPRRPAEPHWYLGVLGVDPDRQRQGLGTALLEPVLRECDVAGLPCYLETVTAEDVRFYSRLGWRERATVRLPDGGPSAWCMWREPVSGT